MKNEQNRRDVESEIPERFDTTLMPPEIEDGGVLEANEFKAWNDAQRRSRLGDERVEADNVHVQEMLQAAENSPHRLSNELKQAVANEIWEAMCAKGITRAELARRLNKSRAYVTKLLSGGQNLSLDSLARLAEIVGCDLRIDMQPRFQKPWALESRERISVLENLSAAKAPFAFQLFPGGAKNFHRENKASNFKTIGHSRGLSIRNETDKASDGMADGTYLKAA